MRLLTIWARQNLQLLTSSKSGWRALVQVMSPLVHVDLKWSEDSGCSAYKCGISPVLYRLLYLHDLSKLLRIVRFSARAWIFTISYGKVKNLSRLLSVLHCTKNSYIITIAVQIQLQHFWAPKWRPSSTLAEIAKNWSQSAGGVRGGRK